MSRKSFRSLLAADGPPIRARRPEVWLLQCNTRRYLLQIKLPRKELLLHRKLDGGLPNFRHKTFS